MELNDKTVVLKINVLFPPIIQSKYIAGLQSSTVHFTSESVDFSISRMNVAFLRCCVKFKIFNVHFAPQFEWAQSFWFHAWAADDERELQTLQKGTVKIFT